MDMQGHLYRKLFKGALWVIGLMICLAFMIKDNYYYFGKQLFFIPSLIVTNINNKGAQSVDILDWQPYWWSDWHIV